MNELNQNSNILYFIPARAGSKGIRDKNIQMIGSESLVTNAIKFLLGITNPESIVISSDSKQILNMAKSFGVKPSLRPEILSTDVSLTVDVVADYLQSAINVSDNKYKWIVIIECTTPFRRVSTFKKLVKMINLDKFDSIVALCPTDKVLWNIDTEFASKCDKNGFASRRQDRTPSYVESGSFYATRIENIYNKKIFTGKIGYLLVDEFENVDINTPTELKIAQSLNETFMGTL